MAYVVSSQNQGCANFVRYLMFGANFIIWLASIGLIVLGIWTAVDRPFLEQLLGSAMYMTAAYLLIATGFFVFFLSFLGCYGAIREVKCMILTYAVIVLLLFIILLVCAILGYTYRSQAENLVRKGMKDSMKEYEEGSNTPVTRAWDDTQQALQCCAISQQSQWPETNEGFDDTVKVPKSCCKRDDGEPMNCKKKPTKDNSFQVGCFALARTAVRKNAFIVGCVGVVVAVIMVLGFVLAIFLYKSIN